jgi:hypothetical protein
MLGPRLALPALPEPLDCRPMMTVLGDCGLRLSLCLYRTRLLSTLLTTPLLFPPPHREAAVLPGRPSSCLSHPDSVGEAVSTTSSLSTLLPFFPPFLPSQATAASAHADCFAPRYT